LPDTPQQRGSAFRSHAGKRVESRPRSTILTTGGFTSEARKEATRDGVPPIELVDSEKLISMFARAELGLRPIQTFEMEDHFFDEFRR
jgi:restriction system protein